MSLHHKLSSNWYLRIRALKQGQFIPTWRFCDDNRLFWNRAIIDTNLKCLGGLRQPLHGWRRGEKQPPQDVKSADGTNSLKQFFYVYLTEQQRQKALKTNYPQMTCSSNSVQDIVVHDTKSCNDPENPVQEMSDRGTDKTGANKREESGDFLPASLTSFTTTAPLIAPALHWGPSWKTASGGTQVRSQSRTTS